MGIQRKVNRERRYFRTLFFYFSALFFYFRTLFFIFFTAFLNLPTALFDFSTALFDFTTSFVIVNSVFGFMGMDKKCAGAVYQRPHRFYVCIACLGRRGGVLCDDLPASPRIGLLLYYKIMFARARLL